MIDLFSPLHFSHGPSMKNRFMLAPLTNTQSHEDGSLSDDEYRWLTMRAEGGFGVTMTCAAHVQACGQGFPGQLGVFSDSHLPGLSRLAEGIKSHDSVAVLQLHHAGMRSPRELVGEAVCPSDNSETGARGLSITEVEQLTEDFVSAAERAQQAGFDGVEIHGAHGYILCQFLSPTLNRRDDRYGGCAANRARIIFDIINGIRQRCRADFNVGLRLSPERFDLQLQDIIDLAQQLMNAGDIDYLDMSLWDVFKEPNEEVFKGRSLLSYFTELDRGQVRLGVAGKMRSPDDVRRCMAQGIDFVLLGRAAIIHHDFPSKMHSDEYFQPLENPVAEAHLRAEGLGDSFITYMRSWKGFVDKA